MIEKAADFGLFIFVASFRLFTLTFIVTRHSFDACANKFSKNKIFFFYRHYFFLSSQNLDKKNLSLPSY